MVTHNDGSCGGGTWGLHYTEKSLRLRRLVPNHLVYPTSPILSPGVLNETVHVVQYKIGIYREGTGSNPERCQPAIHLENSSIWNFLLAALLKKTLTSWGLCKNVNHKYECSCFVFFTSLIVLTAVLSIKRCPGVKPCWHTVLHYSCHNYMTASSSWWSESCEWCGANRLWELWFSGSLWASVWLTFVQQIVSVWQ